MKIPDRRRSGCNRREFLAASLAAGAVSALAGKSDPAAGPSAGAGAGAAIPAAELAPIQQAAAALLLDWARLLASHYGPKGSMDLDLIDYPQAEGPSYYNQFAHYALLLLSEGVVPGADAAERVRYRRLALANLEYVLGMTDAQFHTPHYSRGRDWGRHVGEWLNYYLLSSLELMEKFGVGSAELRARIAAVVTGATTALHATFRSRFAATPRNFPGNHAVWHGLLFFRAGRFFRRPEWVDFARDFFARCVLPFQTPAGCWPEGGGVVVNYAMVTAEAVSLYAEYADDAAARSAVDRALGFAAFFNLPDSTSAVVIDNRMRYHAEPFMALPPGFLSSAEGRRFLLGRILAARQSLARKGVSDNGAQVFAFFGSLAELACASRVPSRRGAPAATATLPAARVEQDGWVAWLGWQLAPESPSRFILDSQNFLEIWQRDAGYLVGGGNSKYMPRFSTIRRTDQGRAYLADQASGGPAAPGEATATFRFGPDEVRLRLTLRAGRCEFGAVLARHESSASYEAALTLPLQAGEVVQAGGGRETIEPKSLVNLSGARLREGFTWRGRAWQVPPGALLEYPLVPHNPYTQDGLPAASSYVGRLSFPLSAKEQVVIIG